MGRSEDVNVIPRDPNILAAKWAEMLQAANGTGIYMYRRRFFTFDPSLNRTFRWVFTVADIPHPIIRIDFLQHFDLLVDVRFRKIIDRSKPLTVGDSYAIVNKITPQ